MKRPYDKQTEEELMEAVKSGQLDAFDELCLRFQPRLYSFSMRHLRREAVAEDVVQEALLRLFKHRADYRGGSRVSTWLFTIALNLIRDWFRANNRMSSLSQEATQWAAESSRYRKAEPDAQSQAEKAEMAQLLLTALEELPEGTRKILELRAVEGVTFEEAARQAGVRPDAARAAASRAYAKLRAWMKSRNIEG